MPARVHQAILVNARFPPRLVVIGLLALALTVSALGAAGAPAAAEPGTRDTEFGSGGVVSSPLLRTEGDSLLRDAHAVAVVRQPGGRLVAAARVETLSSAPKQVYRPGFALVGFTPAGSVDTTFGHHGMVITNLPGGGEARALVRQPNGRLVVAGRLRGRMLLAGFTPSGRVDRSFGHRGTVVISPARAAMSQRN